MSNIELLTEKQKLESELFEMENLGWTKWMMFDPSQLSHWIRVRKARILTLQQQIECIEVTS